MQANTYWVLFISWSTLISWFLSYLYHPVMIRYLSIEDFGTFWSILAVMNLFWVLINSFGLFYQKEVSRNIDNISYSKSFNKIWLYYVSIFTSIVSLFFLICIPFLSIYLKEDYYYFFPLLLSIIFSFLAITNNSYLKALKKFKTISLMILGISLIKLIFGFILVFLWFNIFWALWGFIISQIIMFSIWFYIVKNIFSKTTEIQIDKSTILSSFLSQKKQILQYLFTSILIALFMNIDILIVKNMFSPETAGYYAAISVLAKFLVFLWLSIETVYYPQLVKEKVFPIYQLMSISIYYIILTLWAVWFFYLFWETILRLFKDGLQNNIGLVYPLLIYCGILAYLSIIVKTLVAFERYTINYLLGILIIGLVFSIYSLWNSPIEVTKIFVVFSWIWLLLGLSQIFYKPKKR